ncbi:AN1-type zinc finger protein 4 [Seriola lalandi dorsalis]|uniref:Zinc finger, AN1-type domain 4 n=1 Tax=Seriola lalandi dorsalis TaxID=1841481 RepID=A0A3B4YB43_SERLL|nr:AN1-type zinc finger protein 4 [Seriola lalandi dorsalis]XP_023261573.1 AN1-type zinc finger protein 4 [Seriola lalandi dorsalis]XP_023261574.1 AN1-type zinc finger protein 4 [Seriola lalandi dorsalis]XP_023261575.1 AN1-type zinc finger protein 4 [Seriola lalandi dorsalis]
MTDRKEPPFFNDDSVGAFHYKIPFYDTMELFVETLTGTCFELRVLPFEAVISVKAKIQRLEGIPVAQQHLIWNNLELDDEHCLHDYGIAEGCTLKLVLAMRGGPINTRRVTMEDPIKEVADLMESTKEEGWEKSVPNKQVTFVVYREGDQLNLFRVVDRGDGTLTPLSESLSGGSVYNVYAEEEEDGESSAAAQQSLENSITMTKMKLLKAKMEDMNLNKKPKKAAKVKPRPPVNPHPCGGSQGPSSTRHHHRLFRSFPQITQPRQSNAQLPPIADHETTDPSPPSAAATSANLSIPRRQPPSFSSPSCYMLQEEEQWETCPPFAKIRPPPKVSRLDIGTTRLMRDCVYPQLPPLCTRGPPEATFDPAEPAGDAVGLGLLEEATGLVALTQPGAPFGDLSDPLSLDVSTQSEGGCRSLEVGAQHQLPLSPSPLSTWTLGTSDTLTNKVDRTQLGTSFHISPCSPLPASTSPSTSTRPLPQPFDSTLSCLQPNLQAQSSAQVKPGNTSSHPSTSSSIPLPRLRGVQVESPGKRPELISKREARGITKLANQACKEPLGPLNKSDLLASLSTRAPDSSSTRDSLGESPGLALAWPPATASGQGSHGSRLPSIPTNRLLQDDLIRQMSPLHRAAASYMATNTLASAAGVMTSFGRIGTPNYHLPPVKAPTGSKKKGSKHCFLCGKKTGLATSYECRCGHNFCATHRYAETHDCTYDYKSAGRRFLQETNPLISAPKLPKI